MSQPSFVWCDAQGQGRNVFVLFRRAFRLTALPKNATIHLFADTRYRLRVNGHVAAYGPARFTPKAPQYDTVDLAPYLAKGRNVVTVEVNHKGASSFESHPSRGGFVAWGKIGAGRSAVDFATPGAWKARRLDAVDAWSAPFSFAQGPVEVADLRDLPLEWFEAACNDAGWPDAIPLKAQDAWGPLTPRSIPMLTMHERIPERTLLLAALDAREYRIGCRIAGEIPGRGAKKPRACYATNLYSPEEQDVTLGIWWGPNYLNGQSMERTKTDRLGNREDYAVRLRKGWNFLYGEPELLAEGWGILIGIPAGKGIVASAEMRVEAPECMLHTGPVTTEELERVRTKIPSSLEDLPRFASPWIRVPRGVRAPVPAREFGWDTPGEKQAADPFAVSQLNIPAAHEPGGVAVFDFGGEFLGHARLDIEAPAGTVVDVCNEERIRADGMLNIFKTHWGVNSADRFILRGGRETIEGFHPRGGRYLQVAVRNAGQPVKLHGLSIRQTTYPLRREGRFECSDPLFNWVWKTGVETLQACMEDAYLDCPWRERGLYTGDTLAEYYANRAVSADPAMMRRCIWLWSKAQMDDGQMQDVVPSWKFTPLHDYTVIWVLLLRDYWALTGDGALVEEVWPSVARIFASPAWVEGPSGLWNADKLHVFCDWGADKETKRGESGPLNAYRYRALQCAAELATVLKKSAESARYRKEATRVRIAFQTLWDDRNSRFAPTRIDGKLPESIATHSNLLALYCGLADRKHAQTALRYVEERMKDNLKLEPGHVELFFFHFLLNVLYAHGRSESAEQLIRSHYGRVRGGGAWTIWEGLGHNGSLCHAWSCAPMQAFSERTLGVRQIKAGHPDVVLLAPDSASLTWANGSVPHRKGTLDISWRVDAGKLYCEASVPKGVRVEVKPAGPLAKYELKLQLKSKIPEPG